VVRIKTQVYKKRTKTKQILDDLKETRRYWKLKQGKLDCILLRSDFEEAMDLS